MSFKSFAFAQTLPDSDSFTLGLYRALHFGWLLFYFAFENTLVGDYPLFPLIENPSGLFAFFRQGLFQIDVVRMLYPIWLISLLFSCIGLLTRFSLLISMVLGYWTIGHTMSVGILSHQQFPHLLVFLIFACSDGGREFSMDRKFFGPRPLRPQWEYSLPLFLLKSILILIFFSSAIAKIKNGGLLWYAQGNISDMFARANLWFLGFQARELFPYLNIFLVKNPIIGASSAFFVFIVEILSPLVIFKKFRWPLISILAIFQIVATFALYVDFESFIGLYLFWIPLRFLKGTLCNFNS